MYQTRAPKKGRTEREGCRKAPALLQSYDGAQVEMSTPRLCPMLDQSAALALGEWTDWNGDGRNRQDGCLHKTAADARRRKDAINEPPAQKDKKSALPLIKKGAGRETALRNRNAAKSKDISPTLKASNKGGRHNSLPILAGDMTPWVRSSPSESSLTALLRSIPSPRTCSDNMADRPRSQREPQPAVNKDSWDLQAPLLEQQPQRDKTSGRAKQRGRTGVTKRRFLHKLHVMKLPPVPAVTELSFSRNFSFSFFELPQHQSPQHWLQRQRSVYTLMRQLE